jgi:hypothetical protein
MEISDEKIQREAHSIMGLEGMEWHQLSNSWRGRIWHT